MSEAWRDDPIRTEPRPPLISDLMGRAADVGCGRVLVLHGWLGEDGLTDDSRGHWYLRVRRKDGIEVTIDVGRTLPEPVGWDPAKPPPSPPYPKPKLACSGGCGRKRRTWATQWMCRHCLYRRDDLLPLRR
jgi:hypothetical protein